MRCTQALKIAEGLVERMRPGCERIEIVGSIRRQRPDVKDIEILAQPNMQHPRPVFGQQMIFTNMLAPILFEMEKRRELSRIKGGAKYQQFHVFPAFDELNTIALDLFLVTPPAQWGVLMVIRTGPNKPENNFSQWMVTPRSKGGALPDGYFVKDGAVWVEDEQPFKVLMPEEKNFFEFCGLAYVEPAQRTANWQHLFS